MNACQSPKSIIELSSLSGRGGTSASSVEPGRVKRFERFNAFSLARMKVRGIRAQIATIGFAVILLAGRTTYAQAPPDPEIGFVFPPGGKAGTTVEVKLGGVNWTPDLQFFVFDDRVRLEPHGALGRLQLPEPPYLIGPKAYYPPPLPRELAAKFVIPADVPSGPIRWQVANANGTSQTGIFIVSNELELLEDENRSEPQRLERIPITISGRLRHNEEIDRYRFRSETTGPVTCTLAARSLGSQLNGVVEVRNARGQLIVEEVDSRGTDVRLTLAAVAGDEYLLNVRELDFRGHQAFVYRLSLAYAPSALAALPAGGARGETRDVEFIGVGVKTGAPVVESVTRKVAFPIDAGSASLDYRLETPFGNTAPFRLLVSDLPELVHTEATPLELKLPSAVTSVFTERDRIGRYHFSAKKAEVWDFDVWSARLGTPLDLTLSIVDTNGKEIASNDDSPGTTDPSLSLSVPDDGTFEIVVRDQSAEHLSSTSIYRLAAYRAEPDFRLEMPQRLNAPLGEKSEFQIKAVRVGGFREPITIAISGLPSGITHPAEMVIPAEATELKVPLQADVNAASGASLVRIVGAAKLGERELKRAARAQAGGSLVSIRGDENFVDQMLVAATMKPRVRIWPVESDERTVNRGSTHPAEIGIERLNGFQGEMGIQMDSRQPHKFRQGMFGADIIVPAKRDRVFYPVFVPQMAETLDAYRLSLVAVAKVPDPRGNVRYLLSRMQDTVSIGITVEGALLKISSPLQRIQAKAGQPIDVPIVISSSPRLHSPVRLEFAAPPELAQLVQAEPMDLPRGMEETKFRIQPANSQSVTGTFTFQIRAVAQEAGDVPELDDQAGATPIDDAVKKALKSGSLPVISETAFQVEFVQ